jgi:hypothetical protein
MTARGRRSYNVITSADSRLAEFSTQPQRGVSSAINVGGVIRGLFSVTTNFIRAAVKKTDANV